jgi:multiple sugar transport system ATP-binding protein
VSTNEDTHLNRSRGEPQGTYIMADLKIADVRKNYGTLEVIHGVSFDVTDGEFVVLVGPSGCGKSTLLRMIAGLEDITDGEISIGNRVVNDLRPKDRDIAMVFQNYALYPHMTVAKNMGFSLKLRYENKKVIDRKVKEAAAILGLSPYLDRLPRQLSGGQRQRVAMGRAIVRSPQVFLFDEPLSNLDAKLRVQMRTEIKDLHQRLRTTTIYVTHDQIEAMTMADKIVVLRDGLIEQVGSPLELYDRPANMFVASFIGSPAMNIIGGEIVEHDNRLSFVAPGGIHVPLAGANNLNPGDKVNYGIRPESFSLAADGIIAEILLTEPTGAETQVHMKVGGVDMIGVFRERVRATRGEKVHVAIDLASTHLFDASTGARFNLDAGSLR